MLHHPSGHHHVQAGQYAAYYPYPPPHAGQMYNSPHTMYGQMYIPVTTTTGIATHGPSHPILPIGNDDAAEAAATPPILKSLQVTKTHAKSSDSNAVVLPSVMSYAEKAAANTSNSGSSSGSSRGNSRISAKNASSPTGKVDEEKK